MLLKNSCPSPYSSSSSLQNSSQVTGPILWGSLFILLVILASFTLAAAEDQFDEDGFPLFEAGPIARAHGYLYWETLPALGLALAIFAAAMRLEYLTSHIGEKRPDSHNMVAKSVSLCARHLGTVLFPGTVFFVAFPRFVNDVNRQYKVFHSC